MPVGGASDDGVHRTGPGQRLATHLHEATQPLVRVGQTGDALETMLLLALFRVVRIVDGQRPYPLQQDLLTAQRDVDGVR